MCLVHFISAFRCKKYAKFKYDGKHAESNVEKNVIKDSHLELNKHSPSIQWSSQH